MALPKAYETVARFGAISTTGDPEGEITETGVLPEGDLDLPTGDVVQRPPAFSAVKIGGQRAYKLARAGERVETAERTVRVHRFDELARDGARRTFAIECSSGTYVRSLVADLGDAYCEALRRTAIGPFRVRDAVAPDALADRDAVAARLIGLGDALAPILPIVTLAGDDARAAAHGRAVPGDAEGEVLLADADGPIAIAEPREAGCSSPS